MGSKMHSSTLQAIGLEVKCTERERRGGEEETGYTLPE